MAHQYQAQIGGRSNKCGIDGYDYFIRSKYSDQVISCWTAGAKAEVEDSVVQVIKSMNNRDDTARLQTKHQKTQTMKSISYGDPTCSLKLRRLETS